jgi:hypothetical protein
LVYCYSEWASGIDRVAVGKLGGRVPDDVPDSRRIKEVIQLTHGRIVNVLGALKELDLEIVYVDDGSKDQSRRLVARYRASRSPRVLGGPFPEFWTTAR